MKLDVIIRQTAIYDAYPIQYIFRDYNTVKLCCNNYSMNRGDTTTITAKPCPK